ncbi:hypothetical protein [Pseudomonas japonica]|uniref:Uracil DNA glycosylase superfamily protein n=1 Tax=Pseudomonas japonica TaxID=256466 RepID=A0A238ZYY2_9PSED|nr:hypothetical protein [Pseudomonas japonica]SNR87994.1 hypothetical protein SAMN05444352_10145 [Pseudomonas japonica]
MSCLPSHGRVTCTRCHRDAAPQFDVSRHTEGDWRITANPLAWGSTRPEIVVLGFSKGPTQAGALASTPHDDIAFKGSRLNVGKILAHVGLIPTDEPGRLKKQVDRLIADTSGRFHFASLVRCSVERYDRNSASWKGSGGGMLDKFIATPFGTLVATNCTTAFLRDLPEETRLIVMFGLGTGLNYVASAYGLFRRARPGAWKMLNAVAYTDGKITVVHVEHFAAQGALIPNWLGEKPHPRSELGLLSRAAVAASGVGGRA